MPRNIYRKTVPTSLRQSLWKIHWVFVPLTADYPPRQELLQDSEQYWHARENNAFLGLSYKDLIDLCSQEIREGDRVLDFGRGEGNLILELAKVHKINALGIDISERATEFAKQPGLTAVAFRLQDKEDLLRFGNFNVAIATVVLKHIQDAKKS